MPYLSLFAFAYISFLIYLDTPSLIPHVPLFGFCIGFIPMWFINYKLTPGNKAKFATYSVIIAILLHTAFLYYLVRAMAYTY